MPVKVACTHCQTTLMMPESMYGQQVRCPKCQQIFQCPPAPAEQPAPPPRTPRKRPPTQPNVSANPFDFEGSSAPPRASGDALEPEVLDDDDQDDRPLRRSRRPMTGWGRVQSAVLWLFISAGCFFLAFAFIYLPFALRDPMKPPESQTMMRMMVTLSLLLVLAGAGLGAAGQAFCAAAPSDSGVRGPAMASGVLMLIGAVIGLPFTFIIISAVWKDRPDFPQSVVKILPLMALGYIGLMFASFLVFMFFTVLVGAHLKRPGLVLNTIAYTVVFFLSPMIIVGLEYFREMIVGPSLTGPSDSGLQKWLPLVLMIVNTGWFCFVVAGLRAAVTRAVDRGNG